LAEQISSDCQSPLNGSPIASKGAAPTLLRISSAKNSASSLLGALMLHRRAVHHRARAWPPCLAGVESIQLGGIADKLEAVAALDQGQPLRDQALKLDGPHL
jgi:hypothetical protein